MTRPAVIQSIARGPLFISREILTTACFVLWALNFYLTLDDGSRTGASSWRMLDAGLDLLGLVVAAQASDASTPRNRLPYLRTAWLALNLGSGYFAVQDITPDTGLALTGANALFCAVTVLLLSHLWSLRGLIVMTIAAATINTGAYGLAPRPDPLAVSTILFLSFLPGVVATVSVLLRRDVMQKKSGRALSARLDALTESIDAKTSLQELRLASTRAQIDELFAKVGHAPVLPLDPAVALEARQLATDLRQLLLEGWSGNWLSEALELEGLGSSVIVAYPTDAVEDVPERSRPAILAASMLMAVGATLRGTHRGGTIPRPDAAHRIHFFVERSGDDGFRLTWRVSGVQKSRLSPLLWNELESLGGSKVRSDRAGCTIVVETARWRR